MKFLSEKGKFSIPRYKKKNLFSKDSSSVEIRFSDK